MSKEMRKYIDTFKQRLTESENLNISDVMESKKSGVKEETTVEKWMEEFIKDTGLTKEEALKKLKEFAEELKKIQKK